MRLITLILAALCATALTACADTADYGGTGEVPSSYSYTPPDNSYQNWQQSMDNSVDESIQATHDSLLTSPGF